MINVDSQSFILFSLVADFLLVAVLLFPWLRDRNEWHALFWAIGQTALSTGTAVWFLGSHAFPAPLFSAALLSLSVAGFWAGTEYFIGNLQRRHWLPGSLSLLGFSLLAGGGFSVYPQWVNKANSTVLALVFLWSGLRLATYRNHYRVLGFVLVLRALFNLINVIDVMPQRIELWFFCSVLIKAVSMLCLIFAVQEKIRQRYAYTIDSLSNGFMILDMNGYIHVINGRGASLLGKSGFREMRGHHIADHFPGISRDSVARYFQRFSAAAGHYPYIERINLRSKDGTMIPLELIASPYLEGNRSYCMIQMMDISERKQKDDQLYRAAHFDSVTGFYNRNGFIKTLSGRLELLERDANPTELAVLLVDLDKFKRINDSFGHQAGEQLLKQIAVNLENLTGSRDLLARFSGDEFVIVLSDLDRFSAATVAKTVGEHISRMLASGFTLSGQHLKLTASIGFACYPAHGNDAETLIRNADIAMYEAKKSGRGHQRLFDQEMVSFARDAVVDNALRGAIANSELQLVYQPITEASTGKVRKVEALLRWHSNSLGLVSPDRFIPIAEESGQIIEIGNWVLNQACRQLAQWRQTLGELTVSINVSARQLVDPAFVQQVERALSRNGLKPQQLELELTERVLIDDGPNVREVLQKLGDLGVVLALDDFGTGYSSLSYLTQFRINTLKIDRSFVIGMEHSQRHKNLVATIIAMGQSLELELVAEGVETIWQAHALQQMGCHYIQGYFVSRPATPDLLVEFIVNSKRMAELADAVLA